jgi:3-deoxy-7-phosphoheptulonate synthase/chorismate mutase
MTHSVVAQHPAATSADAKEVTRLRAELDRVNLELLSLLEKRGRLVRQVMSVKGRIDMPRRDDAREREMIGALLRAASDVYSEPMLVRIFTAIFEASRELRSTDSPAPASRAPGG